jgi:C-terminal processing protease CtpA/Prc
MKTTLRSRIVLRRLPLTAAALISLFAINAARPTSAQSINTTDRDRGHVILKTLKNEIKKNYYDPGFHGLDLEALFKTADEKVDRAVSVSQIFGIVAQTLIEFNDSHLFFIPPSRAARSDYGWQWQAIGDKCYVVAVKPGSDAEQKELLPGDLVVSIDNFQPARDNVWKLDYLYHALRPQPGMRVVVQHPGGKQQQIDVMAKVTELKRRLDPLHDANDYWNLIRESENLNRLYRDRYYEMGDDLMIWKMPHFESNEQGVDDMMPKVRKHKALVLDLRGNSGGAEETLKRMIGYFIDHDTKVGDLKRRKETKPLEAKAQGGVFTGKLIVLIDSRSASSSEIFACVIQIEKRGTVIGDHSAGAVMRAMGYSYQLGADVIVPYAASITDADLIMTDGKSLEKSGVTPDELLLPTAADLAARRDPVLARAAALAGVKLDPEKAGSMFPVEWRK